MSRIDRTGLLAGVAIFLSITLTAARETAYLGVQLREETRHPEGGARVTEVLDDSPAAEGGIREEDIIVGFDGEVVHGPVALTERIHAGSPGDRVGIVVIRDGRPKELVVELGNRAKLSRADSRAPEAVDPQLPELADRLRQMGQRFDVEWSGTPFIVGRWGRPKLGVQLVETTRELRSHLGGSDDEGVLVSRVLVGTPAEKAGIAVGDLIVSVDGESVASSDELIRALGDKDGKTVTIGVVRDRKTLTIEVSLLVPDDAFPAGPRARLAPPLRVAPVAAPPAAPAPPAPPLRPTHALEV